MIPLTICRAEMVRSSGLGNRLFPWARCKIFSHVNNCPMVAPNWFFFRIRPFFRGGFEYATAFRKVLVYDNFEPGKEDLVGIKSEWIKYFKPRWNESELLSPFFEKQVLPRGQIIFSGNERFFGDLVPYQKHLIQWLREITKQKYLKLDETSPKLLPIVLNIRRGKDFIDARTKSDFITKGGVRTPLTWFAKTLKMVRDVLGKVEDAFIISDGTANDLLPVLSLPNTHHLKSPAAITDLINLTRANILLGSGGSSYSAWGSFLGRMPTFSIKGQSLNWFKISSDIQTHYVGEIDLDNEEESYKILESALLKQKNPMDVLVR